MPGRSRRATVAAQRRPLLAAPRPVRRCEPMQGTTVTLVDDIDAKLTAGYTFPSRWYWDPAIYRLEVDHIWARSWHYICGTDAIPGGHRLREPPFPGPAGAPPRGGGGGASGAGPGAGRGRGGGAGGGAGGDVQRGAGAGRGLARARLLQRRSRGPLLRRHVPGPRAALPGAPVRHRRPRAGAGHRHAGGGELEDLGRERERVLPLPDDPQGVL